MRRRTLRLALPWLGIVVAGALATWLRFGLIESPSLAQACNAVHSPWWCGWRQALVLGFLNNVYGIAALAAAAWSLATRATSVAWLAAALGLFALQLYGFQSGALALLVGCLRLLQAQARREPAAHDRPRQGDAETQP